MLYQVAEPHSLSSAVVVVVVGNRLVVKASQAGSGGKLSGLWTG